MKGIQQVTSKIRQFYWSGKVGRTRVGVAWETCCLNKEVGGLAFTDPTEALTALLTKWVVVACEPGYSNFKAILRYRLARTQPPGPQRWADSPDWFQMHQHKSKQGSNVWNRIGRAWKTMVKFTYHTGPENFDEWLATNF